MIYSTTRTAKRVSSLGPYEVETTGLESRNTTHGDCMIDAPDKRSGDLAAAHGAAGWGLTSWAVLACRTDRPDLEEGVADSDGITIVENHVGRLLSSASHNVVQLLRRGWHFRIAFWLPDSIETGATTVSPTFNFDRDTLGNPGQGGFE